MSNFPPLGKISADAHVTEVEHLPELDLLFPSFFLLSFKLRKNASKGGRRTIVNFEHTQVILKKHSKTITMNSGGTVCPSLLPEVSLLVSDQYWRVLVSSDATR